MRHVLLLIVLGVGATELRAQTTAADHTAGRAGNPKSVAPWAIPARNAKEAPGYVGGGTVVGGGVPGPPDGTFGFDYVGHGLYPHRVFLGFGSRKPGGPYRTDGPRVFDVFSIRPVRKALAEHEGGEH